MGQLAQRKPRVLLVDDDADIIGSLAAWLEDRFDVSTAADGVEALDVLEETSADVIVLDLMMPNMDGASFKRALDARGIRVPVILASAASDVAGNARDLGVAGFLTKPIDLDRLQAMIDRLAGSGGPGGGANPGGGSGAARPGPGRAGGHGTRAVDVAAFLARVVPAFPGLSPRA